MPYSWEKAHARQRRLRERYPPWQPADCPEMFGDNAEKRCVKCGNPLTGRQQRWCSRECVVWYIQNHHFNSGRRVVQEVAEACALCGQALGGDIEVDHIEPADGRHGVRSCIHHLDNLRALHSRCHLERTRAQREGAQA